MRMLEEAVEWLRPLVASKAWDYCVSWKLGGDPSRFFEWMGCCCMGSESDYGAIKVKEEVGETTLNFCKDVNSKHPIKTRACHALSSTPASMPLYAGIHGEVVLTDKATWIHQTNVSQEIVGTRVLIPVTGGLVELFAFKNMEEDHKIVELITKEFKDSFPKTSGRDELCLKTHQMLTCVPFMNLLQAQLHSSNIHHNYDGSSSSSNFSNEIQPFDPYITTFVPNTNLFQLEQMPVGHTCGSIDSNTPMAGNSKPMLKTKRLCTQSRNLAAERNRRVKIKQLLYALRALVPNISKMDQTAILEDAIEYIVKLRKEIDRLNEEITVLEDDGNGQNVERAEVADVTKPNESQTPSTLKASADNRTSQGTKRLERVVMHMEVKQIDKKDFLLKIFHEKMQGGIVRLMDAVFSMRLRIVDANITTSNDKVLNILRVQSVKQDLHPDKLRELLLEAVESRLQ